MEKTLYFDEKTEDSGRDTGDKPVEEGTRLPERSPRFEPIPAYAALDLGTNNCRLLVAVPTPSGFKAIDAFSRIVRLGEGLSITQRLSDQAIERTLEALTVCKNKMQARRVRRIRLVATEACRLAENGFDFIRRVRNELGLSVEVISPRTEARLATAGCASLVDPDARSVIVFDIGGGSTEIAWLRGRVRSFRSDPCQSIRAWDSLPVGIVPLAERYKHANFSDDVFERMVADVSLLLAKFSSTARNALKGRGVHLLGASGTVTTIGGIHLGLPRYNRAKVDGLWMNKDEVGEVISSVSGMSLADRIAHACIGKERADLVLAGCAILEAIRREFPCDRLRIADRGLREGILMGMMRKDGVWSRFKEKHPSSGKRQEQK